MGISHPLSDEYDALRGAVLSPERTPPSSPPSSCCAADHDYLEHQVSRMDTLAGIAIKYGVEISDIKRANGLVSDSQMFALKTLLIPLPGRPIPSSVRLNGSGQRTKRAWAPNHEQSRDGFGLPDSPKSGRQETSPAMSTLQRYYGLTSQRGNSMDCSTEMSVYHKGSFQSMVSEKLLDSSAAPGTQSTTERSWDCDDPANDFSATNGAIGGNKPKQDVSMRRRQKVEADRLSNTGDTQDDFLADPIKAIKSLLPRPLSSIRLNMDTGSTDSSQKSNISFLNGFRSVRKSPSTPNFADTENNGTSMWSSSTWTFNHESFTRPLLDGLPKPVSTRRTKTAMD
ncbi:hypothetical protein EJB05_40864 [Eragrostis curvula]|uniref:LysM domain-containing protein n=1 Tax=Eragrostis curvula TaxID=38414 RepID=A0A5J9T984_9POAL|nr:hypothetical protein EJB05_40864 [Eragrostis curvula]